MDHLAAAAIYAQVVGLLSDYLTHKGSKEPLDIQNLTRWAVENGRADLMAAIERNQVTAVSIKAALAEGQNALLAKLSALDKNLASLAAGLGPLDAIAQALRPGMALSEKAREMLCKFEHSGATSAMEHRNTSRGDGSDFEWVFLSTRAQVDLEMDRRFYDDDVRSLLVLGLLTRSSTPKNVHVFKLTRRGSVIAQQLLKSNPISLRNVNGQPN